MTKYPKNVGILMGYANIQYILGFYDEANRTYDKIIQLKPDFINAYVCKALISEYKRIDKTKAVELSKKVL